MGLGQGKGWWVEQGGQLECSDSQERGKGGVMESAYRGREMVDLGCALDEELKMVKGNKDDLLACGLSN